MQTQARPQRIQATFIGLIAPLLWSSYPTLTFLAGDIPPFQMLTMGFSVAFFMSLCIWIKRKKSILSIIKQPAKYWVIGLFGILGFNSFYTLALTHAPRAESFLITSIWPLLALLLGAVTLKEKLHANHIFGCLLGFAGIYLIAMNKGASLDDGVHLFGFIAACTAACIWAGYSILCRLNPFPAAEFMGAISAGCAIGCLILHLALETTVFPNVSQFTPIFLAGVGSMGISYYCWNYGVQYGDLRALSSLSYLGHFTTIGFLMMVDQATLTFILVGAFTLIIGGAMVGSAGLFIKRKKPAIVASNE